MTSMMRVVPLAIDLVLVLVFAAVGRASHGEGLSGILVTAWPFLLACLLAWVVIAALGDQGHGLRAATVLWLVTWLGGMAIRVAAGGTAQGAFVVVAGAFLALVLYGWRLLRLAVRGRRTA